MEKYVVKSVGTLFLKALKNQMDHSIHSGICHLYSVLHPSVSVSNGTITASS